MVDPVSIGVLVGTVVLSFGFGAFTARRRLPSELVNTRRERDQYKRIAQSREVRWEGWPKGPTLAWEPVVGWESDRRFEDTLDENLRRLTDGLHEHSDDAALLQLDLELWVAGRWKSVLGRSWTWHNPNEKPISVLSQLSAMKRRFNGTAEEIASEVRTFLRDPHWGLADLQTGEWFCPEAPIRFVCVLNRGVVRTPTKPEVRFVEVPVAVAEGRAAEHPEAAEIATRLEVDPDLERAVRRIRAGAQRPKETP